MTKDQNDFAGTKVALIYKDKVLTILRDNKPTISNPNMWDFAGGEREIGEDRFQTAERETFEELAIRISKQDVIWQKDYPAILDPTKTAAFMVAKIDQDQIDNIVFGDEGQKWLLMIYQEFLDHPQAIPEMKQRLADFLSVKQTKL